MLSQFNFIQSLNIKVSRDVFADVLNKFGKILAGNVQHLREIRKFAKICGESKNLRNLRGMQKIAGNPKICEFACEIAIANF